MSFILNNFNMMRKYSRLNPYEYYCLKTIMYRNFTIDDSGDANINNFKEVIYLGIRHQLVGEC